MLYHEDQEIARETGGRFDLTRGPILDWVPFRVLTAFETWKDRMVGRPIAPTILRVEVTETPSLGNIEGAQRNVVEGVETKEPWALLKVLGVTLFQGFLFSKPLPQAHFEELIAAGRALA